MCIKECRDLIEMLKIIPENNEKYQAENKENKFTRKLNRSK